MSKPTTPKPARKYLADIPLPKDFDTPFIIPEEEPLHFEDYEPECDSLKLKKQLYNLHLQSLTIQAAPKAIKKITDLLESKKPEVARRAAMTILKLSHLDSSPDLIPLDPDFDTFNFDDDDTQPPTPQSPPSARVRANASSTPTPLESTTPHITPPTFTLTTPPPKPPFNPTQLLQSLTTLLLLAFLFFQNAPHSAAPPELNRTLRAFASSRLNPSSLNPSRSNPSPLAIPLNSTIEYSPIIPTTHPEKELTMSQAHAPRHHWRFFRAGGFDQVQLSSGADLAHLADLDQKLWVALACPTRGLEFDTKTLDLIDSDHDGRIRAPDIIAASKWAVAMLKNPDEILNDNPALSLANINDADPQGKTLLASATQILLNLGKPEAASISAEDTADTVKIFASTQFNGDGILPSDSAADPFLQAVISDILACFDGETDRSGKPGITQPKLDLFFADAEAFAGWHAKPDAATLPLGPATHEAAAAVKAVATKIEDYFARCRLAAFDPRAAASINRVEADYAPLANKDLTTAASEIAAFPLAVVAPNQPLPLKENLVGINPSWRTSIQTFQTQVLTPVLGKKDALSETEWVTILSKFAPFDAWLATKAGASVEKLTLPRVREILAYKDGTAKTEITALIAKDKALEPEATSIAEVDRLVRYNRDLFKLLNNFVAFRDFYSRRAKAVFQVGTLYLDQRSCDLCVLVTDPARHALMAHLSRSYLAYCDLTRKGSTEKMTIAAAVTAGDSDNLMVGRNGIFYDRKGNDWDATITKIVENPISIRQAFFAPYKRAIRFVSDQVAKRAADADAAASARAQAAAGTVIDTAVGTTPPAPPPPPKPKIDVGAVAALGVAGGFIIGALSSVFGVFALMGYFLPFGILGVILAISGPSMLIAFFKLRQRNLGPILDANGWAVNAKAKLNIPFGRSLTNTPKLPPGSTHDLIDPFAEKHTARKWTIAILIILLLALGCWYFGVTELGFMKKLYIPKSSWVQQREADQAAEQKKADDAAALKKLDDEKKAAQTQAAATIPAK